MPSPLNSREIQDLYGSLRHLLHRCPAAEIRTLPETPGGTSNKFQMDWTKQARAQGGRALKAQFDGQWAQWDEALKAERVRHLAQALITYLSAKGMARGVYAPILKNGFRFENGDFVPTDARGQIPT